jgi:hypothetical protein
VDLKSEEEVRLSFWTPERLENLCGYRTLMLSNRARGLSLQAFKPFEANAPSDGPQTPDRSRRTCCWRLIVQGDTQSPEVMDVR